MGGSFGRTLVGSPFLLIAAHSADDAQAGRRPKWPNLRLSMTVLSMGARARQPCKPAGPPASLYIRWLGRGPQSPYECNQDSFVTRTFERAAAGCGPVSAALAGSRKEQLMRRLILAVVERWLSAFGNLRLVHPPFGLILKVGFRVGDELLVSKQIGGGESQRFRCHNHAPLSYAHSRTCRRLPAMSGHARNKRRCAEANRGYVPTDVTYITGCGRRVGIEWSERGITLSGESLAPASGGRLFLNVLAKCCSSGV